MHSVENPPNGLSKSNLGKNEKEGSRDKKMHVSNVIFHPSFDVGGSGSVPDVGRVSGPAFRRTHRGNRATARIPQGHSEATARIPPGHREDTRRSTATSYYGKDGFPPKCDLLIQGVPGRQTHKNRQAQDTRTDKCELLP